MKDMPTRYRDYFQDLRVTVGDGMCWEMKWRCRRCGHVICRNAAGAQSHLAKHLREITNEKAPRGKA